MSPKTWMTTVYFQRYLNLDILARLGIGYLTYIMLLQFRSDNNDSTTVRCAAAPAENYLYRFCASLLANLYHSDKLALQHQSRAICQFSAFRPPNESLKITKEDQAAARPVSYTHLTLPTTPYV